jgi:putative protease
MEIAVLITTPSYRSALKGQILKPIMNTRPPGDVSPLTPAKLYSPIRATMPNPDPNRPKHPELMSPAGDMDALIAAVQTGADAVYFGLDAGFNARHRAQNFSRASLPDVMACLHRHNVKGYLTANVLIFSSELEEVVDLVRAIVAAKVDAVIVQDLGLAWLLSRLAPGLHVHGSTQMTLTEPRGIEFVKTHLGVRRVVLARELSVEDIGRVTQRTDVPLEVFIHGALCVAYSGQCLTSESLGGRSANRGQCAQACRMPYDLIVDGRRRDLGDKAYLLSPQDLAAYDLVDDLVKLGVSCFKIEGRLKSAQYVAATTQTYRQALDAAIGHRPFAIGNVQKQDLAQVFSRGFTHGFLDGVDHAELVPARFPKSRGIRIGHVVDVTGRGVLVELDPLSTNGRMRIDAGQVALKPGDGVVFDQGKPEEPEQGGRIYSLARRGRRDANSSDVVEISFRNDSIDLAAITPGTIVWKTDDPKVRERLEQSYARDVVAGPLPVSAHVEARLDQPLTLTLSDDEGNAVTVESDQPLEAARKHPLTIDSLREQLARLGDTPFTLANLTADPLDPVMAPKSVLNDLRRRAVGQFLALREQSRQVQITNPNALEELRSQAASLIPPSSSSPHLTILTRSLEQLQTVASWRAPIPIPIKTVYADYEDVRKYRDAVAIAREHGLSIALATTRIIKPHEEGLLRQVAAHAPDAILVRNLAGLSFFREQFPHLPLIGDYSLNVANELTAALLHRHGLVRMAPSYDLNWNQLAAMLGRITPSLFEAVIHQHMPMFHMEHCVFCHTLSTGHDYRDCGRPCDVHRVDLRDHKGQSHPLIADVGCRNTVYNATAQSAAELVPKMRELGVTTFRVELLREDARGTAELLERYAEVLAGRADGRATVRSLRVLSQLGVTRGTFDFE